MIGRVAPGKAVDPAEMRSAMLVIGDWLRDDTVDAPARAELAAAVRMSARILAQIAPGASVEVRVPPFVAVQCIQGPRHTRGTPPNVVEMDPRTWLLLAAGLDDLAHAVGDGRVTASGSRAAEVASWLPIVRI
ncbi:hypothetical protein GCM10007298_37240 [Williamsia phyllosphaerae]|uniref:Bacterial SCP orthologue domain-containing protein n=1 Tax=Williamsia phyllosphaerae TaxID=885042 RepID=A0ABQ1V418_9NOCA|nr:hypothetical protein GCM10007298_37240 [Williamsia phyllosphaerae]